jgi:membrane-associated phospholipid phosphatase
MAGAGAFVAGAGMNRGPQRAAAAVILIALALALLVTSGHWLSDIIGGAYFGVVIGGAVALRLRPRDHSSIATSLPDPKP